MLQRGICAGSPSPALTGLLLLSPCCTRHAVITATPGLLLALLAGLGCTLLWLAVARRALPALPISIAMAVTCFVLAKTVVEAVVLPASLTLVYF